MVGHEGWYVIFKTNKLILSNVKIVNICSKKDDDLRTKELTSVVSDCFLEHIKEAPEFWLSNGSIAMVLLGIFKSGSGNINYFEILSMLYFWYEIGSVHEINMIQLFMNYV